MGESADNHPASSNPVHPGATTVKENSLFPSMHSIFRALFDSAKIHGLSEQDIKAELKKQKVKGHSSNYKSWEALASNPNAKTVIKVPLSDFGKLIAVFGLRDVDTLLDRAWFFEHGFDLSLFISHEDRTKIHYSKSDAYREEVSETKWKEIISKAGAPGHRILSEKVELPINASTKL